MLLFILRGTLILLTAAVAALFLLSNQEDTGLLTTQFLLLIVVTLGITTLVILMDAATKRKRLSSASGILLGLAAGLLAAYALSFVVSYIGLITAPQVGSPPQRPAGSSGISAMQFQVMVEEYDRQLRGRDAFLNLLQGVKVILGMICCYIGMSLVLQTKDDFRFVIPYVEFSKQIRGSRPTILDTSAIIDGRIVDIIETRIVQGVLVLPKFVLDELQTVADSQDRLKRIRGRRGLDMLQRLRGTDLVEVVIDDSDVEGVGVDQKLISLAQEMKGRILTLDFNLNKVATLRGVEVINLNDLSQAMRPVVLPGEAMKVRLSKPGENPQQGVGYLDDGTMVVVDHGRDHIGESVELEVTSTLQTSAGRMIFGKFVSLPTGPNGHGAKADSAADGDRVERTGS